MPRFTISDLIIVTAIVALHFAVFAGQSSTGDADWFAILYFSPTLITCLLHRRIPLKITSAAAVHYVTTITWTFLHAVLLNFAVNAYNRANPGASRGYQLSVYTNAWNDSVPMFALGIAFALVYGLICHTAVAAIADQMQSPDCRQDQEFSAVQSLERSATRIDD